MDPSVWPQYVVEPQYIEGTFQESETGLSGFLVSRRAIPSLCIHALKVSLSFVPTGRHGSFRKNQKYRQGRILNSNDLYHSKTRNIADTAAK